MCLPSGQSPGLPAEVTRSEGQRDAARVSADEAGGHPGCRVQRAFSVLGLRNTARAAKAAVDGCEGG